jgi:hypothetical protein
MTETTVRNHTVVEADPDDYDTDDPPALACRTCGLGADTEERFENVTCSGGET